MRVPAADVNELIACLRDYIALCPALRAMPVGAPHSPARAAQDAHIALESRASAAIIRVMT